MRPASTSSSAPTPFGTYVETVQTGNLLTLMDLQMPDLNGIDAIVTIRHEQPQARIIVLTTYEGDVWPAAL